jgi:hypothetical protein
VIGDPTPAQHTQRRSVNERSRYEQLDFRKQGTPSVRALAVENMYVTLNFNNAYEVSKYLLNIRKISLNHWHMFNCRLPAVGRN